uniref:Amino acid adenylation domain-containing protein n=1 Tax=Candidatus Kentrum sp. FW TaxID=2126338 RepID=A0A450U486_9GAMM|nr:MAG: amino acid adenylation domain-containing protein [Candidatus Kentron sp. FW]
MIKQTRLAGEVPTLNLPVDHPRPAVQGYHGSSMPFSLSGKSTERLKQLAREEKTTLFGLLVTVFQILLHRYTGQDDIWIGIPASTSRYRPEFANLVGYLINPVVFRGSLDPVTKPSFRGQLTRTGQIIGEAINHSAYPFPLLVRDLQPHRDSSHTPLFQVMVDFQPGSSALLERKMTDLTTSALAFPQMEGQFDLTLSVSQGETISGHFRYNTDLFERGTIERMAGHFQVLLIAIVDNPAQSIGFLPMLTDAEIRQLRAWNETDRDYPKDRTLVDLFEEQVHRGPDNVALVFDNQEISYRELNIRVNRLAGRLRTLGVGPEVLVGLLAERSVEMVAGLLAILKAGGAYVPLDPEYPKERLAFMAEDAALEVLLCHGATRARLPKCSARVLDMESAATTDSESSENPARAAGPNNLAYVIYTSGSTGEPKGCANEHGGILNRILWMQEEYRLAPEDVVVQKTPFGFDVSVWEFLWPLISGARLVVARPDGHKDPDYLADLIDTHKVSVLHFVPSMLSAFLEGIGDRRCPSLRDIICSGEALAPALRKRFFDTLDARLHNLYGPTEAAIDVSYWQCRGDDSLATVPIGRPIANTQLHILDPGGTPVPVGVSGELHIGGVGVARGYLNRPELTAEKFIPDPFRDEPGARLYRSGDLCRRLPDGNIEFLGRMDNQIKLRGFRIELGEIEAVSNRHPAVRETVVVIRDLEERQQLVAYITLDKEHSISDPEFELKDYLAEKLPDYMVPDAFVVLEQLPMNRNGKIDRKALPKPNVAAMKGDHIDPPRDNVEFRLVRIWEKLFAISPMGVRDNFFTIGGDSLLAIRLLAGIEREFGVRLPLHLLFQEGTVEQLAGILRRDNFTPPAWSPLVCLQPQGREPPLFFVHPSGGSAFNYYEIAALMGTGQPFYALQPRGIEPGEPFHESVEEMAIDYAAAVRDAQPEGAILLGGWSFGGTVAFEIARILERSGVTVSFVMMIDPPTPFVDSRGVEDDIEFLMERVPFYHGVSFDGWESQASREAQVMYLLKAIKVSGLLSQDLDDAHARHWLNLYKHHNKLVDLYKPSGPIDGKIIVFKPSEEIPFDVKMGDPMDWSGFTRAGVEVKKAPGNHFTMVSPVNTPVLVEKMKGYLQGEIRYD